MSSAGIQAWTPASAGVTSFSLRGNDVKRGPATVFRQSQIVIFLTVLSLHLSPVQAAELKLYVGDPQPRNAAIQSALAPGLGQWSNEQPKKAWAVAILTMGAAGGATYLWRQSDRTFDEYERSGLKDDGLFDKHRRQRSQALIVGGVGLAAYLIGIADAYTVAKGAAPVKTSRLNVQMDQDTVGVRYAIQF